ncbi:hemoglobin [Roseomonas rosea]|uniref:Hemoglobin n=1 Tax=Muricoccus roseus TaxID=198092 RepID=A0A1M6N4A2_9PROT|nr:group III truncated hemoglobin [Roseomonas rosea]SHJ90518.1 hemoglobin [Roseomonas rosea]
MPDAQEAATRRAEASRAAQASTGLDEAVIERLVRAFYGRARRDPMIGPLFAGVEDWETHIARLCAFWSSVALMTGRYHGQPMAAHARLDLRPAHFARWLMLFEETVRAACPPAGAEHLLERARRIASSLEHGMAFHRGELPVPASSGGAQAGRTSS